MQHVLIPLVASRTVMTWSPEPVVPARVLRPVRDPLSKCGVRLTYGW
jgi:hypothetical protein